MAVILGAAVDVVDAARISLIEAHDSVILGRSSRCRCGE